MADRVAVMADGRVQQIATPVDLYRRPANRFVADFIGTSNMLAGRVVGGRFLSDELGPLPAPTGGQVQGPAHLVVRPEDVTVSPAGPGEGVSGTVADVQFKGGVSQLAVDVAGLPRPFLVTVSGVTAVSRGDDVRLGWTTSVVVADELA